MPIPATLQGQATLHAVQLRRQGQALLPQGQTGWIAFHKKVSGRITRTPRSVEPTYAYIHAIGYR